MPPGCIFRSDGWSSAAARIPYPGVPLDIVALPPSAWSSDGEHIVFSAPGLFVMDPDGTR
jgi:hypothetical protein